MKKEMRKKINNILRGQKLFTLKTMSNGWMKIDYWVSGMNEKEIWKEIQSSFMRSNFNFFVKVFPFLVLPYVQSCSLRKSSLFDIFLATYLRSRAHYIPTSPIYFYSYSTIVFVEVLHPEREEINRTCNRH